MTRLEKIYREKVVPVLQKEFNYSSSMQLPGIEKISLNIGLGAASQNNKLMEEAVAELTAIAGQKAVVTRAKKSIASFKLREGMPIGARVTLRKDRMWDFLDKLMNFALPRVRDFRGIPDRGFDGRGNFTLGIKEHTIFPEMEADRVENPKGMNITIVTSATTDKEGSSFWTSWACRSASRSRAMSRTALEVKASRKPKFSSRAYNRCPICGRPRAFMRQFGICRICFRNMALRGELPGVRKSSW